MVSGSKRFIIIVAGATAVIICMLMAGLRSRVDNQPTVVSSIRVDENPKSAAVQSFSHSELLQNLGSGTMDPLAEDLLLHLKTAWIFAPSKQPYKLNKPDAGWWDQIGQSQLVDKILKQRRKGFFVECGAYDGELYSNSLFFEKFRDWEGLLIEPDPWNFETLLTKNRKAYITKTCIALGKSPSRADFVFATAYGGRADISHKLLENDNVIKGRGHVQCFPIRSLLAAIGRSHVDYFSLDVEGGEIEILKTFPWEHITVDVWTIEYYVHGGGTRAKEKIIRDILNKTGLYGEGHIIHNQDIMFTRKDVR